MTAVGAISSMRSMIAPMSFTMPGVLSWIEDEPSDATSIPYWLISTLMTSLRLGPPILLCVSQFVGAVTKYGLVGRGNALFNFSCWSSSEADGAKPYMGTVMLRP